MLGNVSDLRGMDAALQDWLVGYQPQDTPAARLFCLAHAGGSATQFARWRSRIHPRIELCPIELPGHWARLQETPYTAMDRCAADLGEALRSAVNEVPYVLLGYSMGATLAFELSRWLRAQGLNLPRCLVAAAAPSPGNRRPGPQLHVLDDASFVQQMSQVYNGIPAAILRDADMLQALVPPMRADMQMLETHSFGPEAPLECPIQAMGGTDDPVATLERLNGWQACSAAPPRPTRLYPGGHFFLEQHVDAVLGLIADELVGSTS